MGSGASKSKKTQGSPGSTGAPPVVQKSHGLKSPGMLAEAQEEYARNFQGRPKVDPSTGLVPPYPTPDKKKDVYAQDKMAALDQHAIAASQNLAFESTTDVVKYLTKNSTDDVSKVRVLYKWLVSQNVEDYDITDDPTSGSVLYELLLVRAKRQNLNHVYQVLCKSANIPCTLIKGTTRPWGYYYGGELVSSHVWCAVFVAGAWRLVDAHLATTFIESDTNLQETPRHVTPRANGRVLMEDQRHLTTEGMTDFFFLTDPYVFIYYNLPDDEHWQLLAAQVSRQQFKEFVYLTPFYFEHDIRKLKHLNGIVKAQNGEATFELSLPKSRSLRCTYRLVKLLGKSSTTLGFNGDYKHTCFLENKEYLRILHVRLREIGRYHLSLRVIDLDSKGQRQYPLCHYFVDVSSPDYSAVSLLPNPRYEYGPGADTTKYEITPISHKEAMIKSEDGIMTIEFKCKNANNLTFSTELLSKHLPKERLKDYTRIALDDQGILTCFIKLPEGGRYLFKLVAKLNQLESMACICCYFIEGTVGYLDASPFPPGVLNFIGDVSGNKWLNPISHKTPLLDCNEGGEMVIEMSVNNSVELDTQTHLELFLRGKQIDLSQYTWTKYQHGKLIIDVTFPDAGIYGLSIFGQVKDQSGLLKHLWRYIINVDAPCRDALPFPIVHSGWNIGCELRSPLSGYLAQGEDIPFEVRIPLAEEVAVMTDHWACDILSNTRNGLFLGSINTNKVTGRFTLMAIEKNSTYTYLLEFKVLDHQEHQKALSRQKTAQIRAANRRRELEHRKEDQLEASKKREKDAKRRAADAEEEFNQQRDRLEKDEEFYRAQEMESWNSNRAEFTERVIIRKKDNKTDAETVAQQVVSVQDQQNTELSTRRHIHKGMRTYLVRERMREGTRRQDYGMLKPALDTFVELRLEEKDQDLSKAKKVMASLQANHELQVAMHMSDVPGIQENIQNIHKRGLYGPLQVPVQEAERLVDRLQRVHRLKLSVLGMEKHTMGEIRSYTKPPSGVKKVMQASFLLLGEDEYTTSDWQTCQKLCSVFGRDSLNRRILDLDIQDIHPEVLARVREILSTLDLSTVQRISAGVATFFVWAMGTTEEAEKILDETGQQTPVPPADIPRQREIFGREPLEDRVLNAYLANQHKQIPNSYNNSRHWII